LGDKKTFQSVVVNKYIRGTAVKGYKVSCAFMHCTSASDYRVMKRM